MFLKLVDEEIERNADSVSNANDNDSCIADQLDESDIEEYLPTISASEDFISDKKMKDIGIISDPSEEQSKDLAIKSSNHAHIVSKKAEKICVAPGEYGSFQNWGQDIFLEEKCFPEKFPYGQGGYLSSCMEDSDKAVGFAD